MMQKCDDVRSAIVFLIPYRTGAVPKDGLNISLYARVKDYHAFFTTLSERITYGLENMFPGERFYGFCDRSPIDEKKPLPHHAGWGVTGMNTLLISPVYGSFVFIGSFLQLLSLRVKASARRRGGAPAAADVRPHVPRERYLNTDRPRALSFGRFTEKGKNPRR